VEGPPGSSAGLGLLDLHTTLEREKQLRSVSGRLPFQDAPFNGYEIHMGASRGETRSADGRIFGTYVHGIFDTPAACAALLRWAGMPGASGVDLDALREASLERLADGVEEHLDLQAVFAWPGA
jgi:adenosylcobyric acid synthase